MFMYSYIDTHTTMCVFIHWQPSRDVCIVCVCIHTSTHIWFQYDSVMYVPGSQIVATHFTCKTLGLVLCMLRTLAHIPFQFNLVIYLPDSQIVATHFTCQTLGLVLFLLHTLAHILFQFNWVMYLPDNYIVATHFTCQTLGLVYLCCMHGHICNLFAYALTFIH